MHIILLHPNGGQSRNIRLPRHLPWLLALMLVVVPTLAGVGAYYGAQYLDDPLFNDKIAREWRSRVEQQQQQVTELDRRTHEELRALTLKMANMQARLVRLDALGERLVEVAGIRSDEFDFQDTPAIGGPEMSEAVTAAYQPPAFIDTLEQLATTLERREHQLDILDGLLEDRRQAKQTALAGRPITHGWMSSRFGYRTDPFNGKLAMHEGMDFAGKDGSDIVATAQGVVTYADERWGYGKLVEINHGNGLSTRYGHCKDILVKPGDIVKPGQVVAKMGSSGRSTGPHVHYEVLKNGRQVNPRPYIYSRR